MRAGRILRTAAAQRQAAPAPCHKHGGLYASACPKCLADGQRALAEQIRAEFPGVAAEMDRRADELDAQG